MNWTQTLATVLGSLFAKPAAAAPTVSPAPKATPGLAAALNDFVAFAGPFVRIVEGDATITDDAAALNAVLNAVALFDPAAAPIATLVEDAEPAALALIGFLKSNPLAITGGYRPELSGFAGARGHI